MYIMIYLTQKFINYLANTAIFSSEVVFADGIHGGSGAVDVCPPSVLRIVPANSHGHAVQAGWGSWGNMGNDHLKQGFLLHSLGCQLVKLVDAALASVAVSTLCHS